MINHYLLTNDYVKVTYVNMCECECIMVYFNHNAQKRFSFLIFP